MKTYRNALILVVVSLTSVGCAAFGGDWPDRTNRTPEEMLTELIQWQQRKYVRVSSGILAHECFTEIDFQEFKSANIPKEIVRRLRGAKDFQIVASALRSLPSDKLAAALEQGRWTARPTWRQMGFIDSEGRGQTEAGHEAELMTAAAIVAAFAVELRTC